MGAHSRETKVHIERELGFLSYLDYEVNTTKLIDPLIKGFESGEDLKFDNTYQGRDLVVFM